MAGYTPFQLATAILVLVAVLQAILYFRNRNRGPAGSPLEGARHDLEAGRRLLGLAECRAAAGNYEAAMRIADRSRVILALAHRRAADAGDPKMEALVDADAVRCVALYERSRRRLRAGKKARPRVADGRLDPRRLALVEALLDEAEQLFISAEEAFASGNFIEARDRYRSVRSRLNAARRTAVQAGSHNHVRLIDADLERARMGLASSNAWVLDGRPVLEAPGAQQVKGVISPYFKREDGSFEPRPR